MKLDLQHTIEIANDSSLSAFRYQNMYLSGCWEFRTYKTNRLPSLTLDLTQAKYYHGISLSVMTLMRIWTYIVNSRCSVRWRTEHQAESGWTGGTFYIDSQLDFMRNFGDENLPNIPVCLSGWAISRACWGIMHFIGTVKIEP